MQHEVKFGSVSWISPVPSPIYFAGAAVAYKPPWVPKTYVGLIATANNPPPEQIGDFADFRKNKQFRALTECRLRVDIDDQTKRISKVESLDGVTDPGWTPPFSMSRYPSAAIGSAVDGWEAFKSTWSFAYHAGEESPLSKVIVNGRHPNSTLGRIASAETLLANVLIKFRAGAVTDHLGVSVVECPFHVPWVWCETALTYQNGTLKLYGRGSIFPTHNWYLNGKLVGKISQVGDQHFPGIPAKSAGTFYSRLANRLSSAFVIDYRSLALYPVLSAGAPAAGGQVPLGLDIDRTGPVDGHPYTAKGGKIFIN